MKEGSSVQRIKQEKRDRRTEPAGGMTRRRFLAYLGVGSAALATGGTGVMADPARAQGVEAFEGAAPPPTGTPLRRPTGCPSSP